ncbi:MAG TPA: nuclear transport factor 2 family protein [Chitinophagaceae bacterium]|nr:nuclear transport factor 2 family protein [Chitinophagaceae bacterium]
MQKFIFILFISLSPLLSAAQSSFLKEAAAKLDKALIAKDTFVLKQLLHKDITWGHSNGWVQTKADIIKDLFSGKFSYIRIDSKDSKWIVVNNVATMRNSSDISYELDGKPGELHLHVVLVWLKTNKGWQLLTRQGTKI